MTEQRVIVTVDLSDEALAPAGWGYYHPELSRNALLDQVEVELNHLHPDLVIGVRSGTRTRVEGLDDQIKYESMLESINRVWRTWSWLKIRPELDNHVIGQTNDGRPVTRYGLLPADICEWVADWLRANGGGWYQVVSLADLIASGGTPADHLRCYTPVTDRIEVLSPEQDILYSVLTASEIQDQYGIESGTVRKALRDGAIKHARRSGNVWLFLRSEIEQHWRGTHE